MDNLISIVDFRGFWKASNKSERRKIIVFQTLKAHNLAENERNKFCLLLH